MPFYRIRPAVVGCALCAVALALSAQEQPIISYQKQAAELAGQTSAPLLQIYADGEAVVQIPSYWVNAGTYRTRLSEQELQQLIAELRQAELDDFDTEQAHSELERQVNSSAATVYAISDDTTTIIDLAIPADGDTPNEVLEGELQVSSFEWTNLQFAADTYDVPTLDAAAAAEQRLEQLIDRIANGQ